MLDTARFLEGLQAQGRYHFSTEEAAKALNRPLVNTRAILRRLKAKREIADPQRGFHVIVPPEYRSLGCLPADQFIPQLMRHLDEPYYVTLLSAAVYHGASHQKPQVFQVMTRQRRRGIVCGQVRVQFVSRHDLLETPTIERNTLRAVLRVASPEATALELVGYVEHAGGLDNVATVLTELAESLNPSALATEARRAPLAWVQRLGYLLALTQAPAPAEALFPVLPTRNLYPVALEPSAATRGRPTDPRWKVVINAKVEPDL